MKNDRPSVQNVCVRAHVPAHKFILTNSFLVSVSFLQSATSPFFCFKYLVNAVLNKWNMYTQTHTQWRTHTLAHSHMVTHAHTHMVSHTDAHTHTHTHSHTHTLTWSHTHTHTHMVTHTQSCPHSQHVAIATATNSCPRQLSPPPPTNGDRCYLDDQTVQKSRTFMAMLTMTTTAAIH